MEIPCEIAAIQEWINMEPIVSNRSINSQRWMQRAVILPHPRIIIYHPFFVWEIIKEKHTLCV